MSIARAMRDGRHLEAILQCFAEYVPPGTGRNHVSRKEDKDKEGYDHCIKKYVLEKKGKVRNR